MKASGLLTVCIFLATSSVYGGDISQDAVAKIRRLLDTRSVLSDEERNFFREYVPEHPAEAIAALGPGLQSEDADVRRTCFLWLIRIPEHSRRCLINGLESEDPEIKRLAIKYGVLMHPEASEIARAFIEEIADTTTQNRSRIVGELYELEPNALPSKEREELRPLLEQLAKSALAADPQVPVILLGKFRDSQSYEFLRNLAEDLSTGRQGEIDYAKLPLYLNVALGMNDDSEALTRVTEIMTATDRHSDRDRFNLVFVWSKHLLDKEAFRLALVRSLPESRELHELEQQVRVLQAERSDVFSWEQGRLELVRQAAYQLAIVLGIPITQTGPNALHASDIARIRSAAATRLGVPVEQQSGH